MPIAAPIQNSFNSGEFSPLATGRTDYPKYKNGVSLLQNLVPLVQGGVTRRPGEVFVKESKSKGQVHLLKFSFSTGDNFMIEFGDLYMRFFYNRAPVKLASQAITAITKANPAVLTYTGADYTNDKEVYLSGIVGMTELNGRWCKVANVNAGANTFELTDLDGNNINSTAFTTYTSGGTVEEVYEIVSPYSLADIEDIRIYQSKDVVYFAHPSYKPRKLSRSALTSWTFTTITFSDGPYQDINSTENYIAISAAAGNTSVSIVAQNVLGINSGQGFLSTDVGRLFRWKNPKDSTWQWLLITAYISTTKVTAVVQGTVDATTSKTISSVTKANPGVVTAVAHKVNNGDTVYISDVVGMTQVNNLYFTAAGVTANTFQLSGVNTTGYTTYVSGGKVTILGNRITGITAASPAVVTSAAHNFANSDVIYIDGVLGMTQVNGGFYTVSEKAANSYELAGVDSSAYTAYSSGGYATIASKSWRMGEWSDTTGYPSVLFSFEDRLGWAASPIAPQTMNFSKTGDYENFAPTSTAGVVTADSALQIRINSGQQNPIRWVYGTEQGLVMGTKGEEWVIRASTAGDAMSALNLPSARVSTRHGSAFVEPEAINKALLFIQTSKRKIRELAYVYQVDGFTAPDMTILAEHITKSGVARVCYQKEPHSILWVMRVDGAMVGLTYDREQDVVGWHKHPLGGYSNSGKTLDPLVESLSSIPSPDGAQDDLWISVKRYVNGQNRRFIGYLSAFNMDFDDTADCFFVDCGKTITIASPTTTLTGLWHLIGETVTLLVDGAVHPDKVVSATGTVTLDRTASSKVQVGLKNTPRLKTLRIEAGSATGTAQGKMKRVHRLAALLHQTVGLWAGQTFDTMQEQTFRKASDPMSAAVPLFDGIKNLEYGTDYDTDGYLCLEHRQPLPLTLLALMPQLHTQDAQ